LPPVAEADHTPARDTPSPPADPDILAAEAKLNASQQQYSSVMASIKDIVFQTDKEGKLMFLNQAWTESTRFSIEESLGNFFYEYIHPEGRDQYWKLFLPLITRQKDFSHLEVRYLAKDSSYRWMELRARLTVNGDNHITGISGTLTDVTKRRLAEEKLRKSEQLYRLISENSRDLITLNDAQANALYISPSVTELLGFRHHSTLLTAASPARRTGLLPYPIWGKVNTESIPAPMPIRWSLTLGCPYG
jgi:PAS domain S-box-containing protein